MGTGVLCEDCLSLEVTYVQALAQDRFQFGAFSKQQGESKPSQQAGESSLSVSGLEATRVHYLIGLNGGFRRRIIARQFRSREYSAMFPRCHGRLRLRQQGAALSPRRAGPARRGAHWANARPAQPPAARRLATCRRPPPVAALSPFPDPSPGSASSRPRFLFIGFPTCSHL